MNTNLKLSNRYTAKFKNCIFVSQRVSELSRCIDMDLKPTLEELVDCFLNKEDIEKIVKAPVI